MITVNTFKEYKGQKKLAQVTCYDYTTAKLVEEAGIDFILVGDSLGMVMMGYTNTLPVKMEDMITYGSSVVRGAPNTFVVVDMPFMSYQLSDEQALMNAGRLIKETGCQAVKLEGGMKYASRIKAITDAGIPVVAHVGLTPQSVNAFGGYKVQGKSSDQAYNLIKDCLAVQEAGAFAVTLECVPEKLAAKVTNMLHISTIGIGASSACDAQVLVNQDMLGSSSGKVAKFVKKYANLHDVIVDAFKEYKDEVVNSKFPTLEQTYKIEENDLEEAIKRIEEEK